MVYNGHRSVILTPKQEPLPLYIAQRNDYKFIDTSVHLLEGNLKRIYRALERLKEFYHVGGSSTPSNNLPFPNSIVVLLYKICEFQV